MFASPSLSTRCYSRVLAAGGSPTRSCVSSSVASPPTPFPLCRPSPPLSCIQRAFGTCLWTMYRIQEPYVSRNRLPDSHPGEWTRVLVSAVSGWQGWHARVKPLLTPRKP
eukprot:1188432-Prorocentrum_minimum.AAC.1